MSNFNNDSTDPWLMKHISDNKDNNIVKNDMKFNDNFEPQLASIQTNSLNSDLNNSIELLPDSQQYIQSLERKLDKLKGKTKEISTKDVINSLAVKRDALLQQFIQSNVGHDDDINGQIHDSNIPNSSQLYTYVERRLFPQSQAITAEELQILLEADILQKINSNNCDNK